MLVAGLMFLGALNVTGLNLEVRRLLRGRSGLSTSLLLPRLDGVEAFPKPSLLRPSPILTVIGINIAGFHNGLLKRRASSMPRFSYEFSDLFRKSP